MEDMILNFALTVVKSVVKNPKKRAALKRQLLRIRDAISMAYRTKSRQQIVKNGPVAPS